MDDDNIGYVIVIIMVFAVAISLIGIVIELVVGTLPAWGFGALSGTVAYGVIRLKLASDLSSADKFSQLVNFGFDGVRLCSEIKPEAVKDYIAPYKIVPVAACVFVTAIVFKVAVYDPSMLDNEENWVQISSFLITAAITVSVAFILWTRLDLRSAVETKVKQALDHANISFQASGELQGILGDNALIAQELQIEFPQDNVSTVREYIDAHKAKVLTDPSSLKKVIAAEIEKAKHDSSRLRKSGQHLDEVMQLHHKVSRTVFATGSPSMVNAVDLIHEQIHQAKEICLAQREWATFEEAMTVYAQDMKQLEAQALNFTAEEEPNISVGHPYHVLGVSSEMDDSEIKKVFRELCNIYHPDKGKVRDATKFKEIKTAYDEIVMHRRL